jgi:HK97 gp10 family phage protein
MQGNLTLVTVRGFAELTNKLGQLKSETQRTIAYAAVSAAARVVKKAAIKNATSYGWADIGGQVTGALIQNIANVRKKSQGALFVYEVGVRHGTVKQIKTGDDPFYWWFHEFGYTARNGTEVRARPFLAPAIESSRNLAVIAMGKRLQARLMKYGLVPS